MSVNLVNERSVVDTGYDNVIILDCFETIRGGRSLNVEGFPDKVICAGHPIILENDEYKPMPVDGSNGNLAVGVLVGSILTEKPLAAIMVRGCENAKAYKEATGYDIPDEVKTKLNLINFV